MSYSNYQLNQRINNLQSQINNLEPSTTTLQGVLNSNNTATNTSEGTNSIVLVDTLLSPHYTATLSPNTLIIGTGDTTYPTDKTTISKSAFTVDIVPEGGGRPITTSSLEAGILYIKGAGDINTIIQSNNTTIIHDDGLSKNYTAQNAYSTDVYYENIPNTDGVYQETYTEPNYVYLAESDGTTENITILTATNLSINGDYGTAGQVLTSGDVGGVLSWSNVEGSQNIASVLTAGSTTDAGQSITFDLQELNATGSNVIDGAGSIITFNLNTTRNTLDTGNSYINLKQQDSTILPFTGIPPLENHIEAGYMSITQATSEIDYQFIKIEPTRINLGNADTDNYGTAGQVLTSGGDAGILSWSDVGGSQNIASVLTAGSTADVNQTISLSNIDRGQTTTLTLDALATTFLSDDGTNTSSNELSVEQINLIKKDTATSTTINSISISNNGIAYYDDTPNQTVYSSKNIYINGTPGTIGDVLTSGGDSGPLTWTTPTVPTLNDVLVVDNTTATSMIITDGAFGGYTNTLFYTGMNCFKSGVATDYRYEKIDTTSAFEIVGPSLALNSDTITIGTSAGSASTISIGHNTDSGITQSNTNISGKLTLVGNLFTGGTSFENNSGAGSYTVPSDAGRNTFYTMVASGTANPTTIILPTDDVGGKYITIYNIGSNPMSVRGSAGRYIYGGLNGTSGGTVSPYGYAVYTNQLIQLYSAGSAGFYVIGVSNGNTISTSPYVLQTSGYNQRASAGTITSLTGTGSGTLTFAQAYLGAGRPSITISVVDASSTRTAIITGWTGSANNWTGFTYSYTNFISTTYICWNAQGAGA